MGKRPRSRRRRRHFRVSHGNAHRGRRLHQRNAACRSAAHRTNGGRLRNPITVWKTSGMSADSSTPSGRLRSRWPGGHNMLMIGPPGSGKTMLAKRIPSILPPMSFEEGLETTRIHSVTGLLPSETGIIDTRPFRSPHHTISDAGPGRRRQRPLGREK